MSKENSQLETNNLGRIREILFGEELESVKNYLDSLKSETENVRKELMSDMNIRYKELKQQIDRYSDKAEKLNQQTADLKISAKADLKEEVHIFTTEIENNKNKFETDITQKLESINSMVDKLEHKFTDSIKQIEEKYIARIDDIEKSKVDKKTLSDFLSQLQEKLNG